MPRLEDDVEHDDFDHFDEFRHRAANFWDTFTSFALRDNVLEVAVGLIFASAFTAVTSSLVTDIILPIVSLLPFLGRNLEEKFLLLRSSPRHKHVKYNTVQQALDDGAVVWAYGSFIDKVLRFFMIALSLLLIAKAYGWLSHDNIVKKQVKCKYCRKDISEKAKRCVNCTSWVDGREDSH